MHAILRPCVQAGDRSALLSAAVQMSQLSSMLPAGAADNAATLSVMQAKTSEVVNALLASTSVDDPKQVRQSSSQLSGLTGRSRQILVLRMGHGPMRPDARWHRILRYAPVPCHCATAMI